MEFWNFYNFEQFWKFELELGIWKLCKFSKIYRFSILKVFQIVDFWKFGNGMRNFGIFQNVQFFILTTFWIGIKNLEIFQNIKFWNFQSSKLTNFGNLLVFCIRKFWNMKNFLNWTILEIRDWNWEFGIAFPIPKSNFENLIISCIENFRKFDIFPILEFWKLINFSNKNFWILVFQIRKFWIW